MGETVKSRNQSIDIIRGIAIIMVVIGHLVTTNTVGAEGTPFYNVIWSLQMPLFFLISGYVNRYSKPIKDAKTLLAYFCRRTASYILPWFTCAIVIRGLAMFGFDQALSKIKEVVWNLDGGYWFLWVLWFVCIMYGVSSYIANKISKSKTSVAFATCVISAMLAVIPLAIGLWKGFNFFGIKLMLYYIPFYYLGYLVSCFMAGIEENQKMYDTFEKIKQMVYLPVLVVYIYIVWHYDLYKMSEGILNNIIRVIGSLCGAFVLCSFVKNIKPEGATGRMFTLAGKYSLEIYILHYLFLSRIGGEVLPAFTSVDGVIRCVVNLSVATLLTTLFIYVLSANKYSRFLCFGKK